MSPRVPWGTGGVKSGLGLSNKWAGRRRALSWESGCWFRSRPWDRWEVWKGLAHSARFSDVLAEENFGAIGEIQELLLAQRDEAQEYITGVYSRRTDLWRNRQLPPRIEQNPRGCSETILPQPMRGIQMATVTEKLSAEPCPESNNGYHLAQELLGKKDQCAEVKEELAKGVDKSQKNCSRRDEDLKTIKTMFDRKENFVTMERHDCDLVQLEEANQSLLSATRQAWKEDQDRILQTLGGNADTKSQAAENGRARLQNAQCAAAQGLSGGITQLSGSI